MSPVTPLLFNAINGSELMEKILRDVRKAFEKDERFRHHVTYPNVAYKFSFSMKYEPGMAEAVNLSGHADARSKIEAQEGVIVALRKQLADRDERFQEIEAQANLLLSDNEKKTRDLADANEFIKKLHAEKLELEAQVKREERRIKMRENRKNEIAEQRKNRAIEKESFRQVEKGIIQ